MIVPADKYLLQDYREDLRSPGAPQMIDTDSAIVPVKMIGAGLPRLNSKQKLYAYHYYQGTGASARDVQVALPTISTIVHFIGAVMYVYDSALSRNVIYNDASAGTGTIEADVTTGTLAWMKGVSGVITQGQTMMPSPLRVNIGIRLHLDATTAATSIIITTVYYLVEMI